MGVLCCGNASLCFELGISFRWGQLWRKDIWRFWQKTSKNPYQNWVSVIALPSNATTTTQTYVAPGEELQAAIQQKKIHVWLLALQYDDDHDNIMIMMLLCANRNNLCFLKETSMLEMLSSALLKAHLGNTFFLNYIFVGWLIILSSPVLVLKVSLSIFTQDWSNMFHAVKTAEIFAADRLTHSVSRYICLNSVFE